MHALCIPKKKLLKDRSSSQICSGGLVCFKSERLSLSPPSLTVREQTLPANSVGVTNMFGGAGGVGNSLEFVQLAAQFSEKVSRVTKTCLQDVFNNG